jgi:hypothetical protein
MFYRQTLLQARLLQAQLIQTRFIQVLVISTVSTIALNAIALTTQAAPRPKLPQVKPAATQPAPMMVAPAIKAAPANAPGTIEAGRVPMATPEAAGAPVLPGTGRTPITPAPRLPNAKPMQDPPPGQAAIEPLPTQQGATATGQPQATGTSAKPQKVRPPRDDRPGFTRDADIDDYEKEQMPPNPAEVRRQQLFFEASQFFKRYQVMTSLYDPSVLDLYANNAQVIMTTKAASGRSTTQVVSKAELETALPISLPAARRRGAYDSFSDVEFKYQESTDSTLDRILITGTRYVSPDHYRVPHSMVVARNEAGRWLILEETVEVRQ